MRHSILYQKQVLLGGVGCLVALSLFTVWTIKGKEVPISVSAPARVGVIAPDFTLTDYEGNEFRLSRFRGQWVLLNFFCGCGPCQQLATAWQKLTKEKSNPPLTIIAISTLAPTHIDHFVQATRIYFPVLFDPGYAVAEQYDSMHCPRCWLIQPNGIVVYTNQPNEVVSETIKAVKQHLRQD